MGDEDDFVIESTDAGASATIPMEAGQIKKGGYVSSAAYFLLGAVYNVITRCDDEWQTNNIKALRPYFISHRGISSVSLCF